MRLPSARSQYITLALAAGAMLLPGLLSAQRKGNSHLQGVVLDAATLRPVPNARVILSGVPQGIQTDSSGTFRFANIADGRYTVQVIVPGVDSTTAEVEVAPRERVEMEFLVGARMGMVLPDVTVTGTMGSGSGREDFERRLAGGTGRYFTKEYIQRRKPQDLMDLMRGVAGARIECGPDGSRCAMRFARSPRGCSPQYYMDGMRTHPSVLYLTLPTDVAGIEIYSGPAQIPSEFAGASARCGVIAIWTHNGRGSRN